MALSNVLSLDDLIDALKVADGLEVSPCRYVTTNALERCSPRDAEVWTVYVHLSTGGAMAIGDVEVRARSHDGTQRRSTRGDANRPRPTGLVPATENTRHRRLIRWC